MDCATYSSGTSSLLVCTIAAKVTWILEFGFISIFVGHQGAACPASPMGGQLTPAGRLSWWKLRLKGHNKSRQGICMCSPQCIFCRGFVLVHPVVFLHLRSSTFSRMLNKKWWHPLPTLSVLTIWCIVSKTIIHRPSLPWILFFPFLSVLLCSFFYLCDLASNKMPCPFSRSLQFPFSAICTHCSALVLPSPPGACIIAWNEQATLLWQLNTEKKYFQL